MAINVFVKGGGTTLEEVSATIDKVLSGYTYNDSEGEVQTGTMPNNGAINETINVGGKFEGNAGYYSSIKVTGPTLTGNAEVSNVLADKTFYSNSGTIQTGTMANRGIVNETIGIDESYSGLEGYYSSINITGPTLTGTATPEVVRVGYTFYSNNGNQQIGVMETKIPCSATNPNSGNVTILPNREYVTGEAGYYEAFTIKPDHGLTLTTVNATNDWANSGIKAGILWGASASDPATSFKVVASNNYIWYTRNAGKDCDLYITNVYKY